MVTIGFIDTQFIYNEDSNTVHIGLGVLEGMLGHSVTVRVEFIDNTALGNNDLMRISLIIFHWILIMYLYRWQRLFGNHTTGLCSH